MRQMTYVAVAAMLAGALACSPQDRQDTANRAESAADEVGDAAREGAADVREGADQVGDEARDLRNYGYAQRNEFRKDMDVRLKNLDVEIAELERDTKRGLDKSRDSALVKIRSARKEVTRNLNRLGSATENTWENLKGEFSQSLTTLQEAVRRERPDARPMGGTGPS